MSTARPSGGAGVSTGNGSRIDVTADAVVATGLRFGRGRLIVALSDGREVSVPLAWYPTLERATAARRNRWQLLGGGRAVHWPDLDLDLSIAGLTRGFPEAVPRPPKLARTTSGLAGRK